MAGPTQTLKPRQITSAVCLTEKFRRKRSMRSSQDLLQVTHTQRLPGHKNFLKELRDGQMATVLVRWLKSDPNGAKTRMATSGLSDDMKSQLLSALENND